MPVSIQRLPITCAEFDALLLSASFLRLENYIYMFEPKWLGDHIPLGCAPFVGQIPGKGKPLRVNVVTSTSTSVDASPPRELIKCNYCCKEGRWLARRSPHVWHACGPLATRLLGVDRPLPQADATEKLSRVAPQRAA